MLFRNNYGVDLGSSAVKVYSFFRNKSYIEKNMVAYRGRRILAIGNEAYEMFEKSPADISVNSPMAFGMLANLELQEIVLYSMIKKIDHTSGLGADMYFSVPLDMTAIEKRAYYHLVNGHWLRKNRVFMVESPIADAIAMGIDPEKNQGSMIVNIGAQSTEFSIITDGKIIISRKIPIGGRQMNESICSEIRKHYNLQIGTRTAKRLKVVMGRLNDQKKEARKVVGIDSISGLPREEVISAYVVNEGIANCVNQIAAEMKSFLERTPPQIAYHIAKEGIYLTGGSTRLPYIDNYLASYTGFAFNLSDLYETSAAYGLEKIIRDRNLVIMTFFCGSRIVATAASGTSSAPLQEAAGFLIVPFEKGIAGVSDIFGNVKNNLRDKQDVLQENEELKSQINSLTEQNNILIQDQTELTRLKELYDLDQEYTDYPKVAARIISKDPGNWYDTFMINKGSNNGIRVDNNVIAGKGLVGIVTEVGPSWATVRSIIDDSSNVSAMAVSTSDNCVVTGDLKLIDEGKLSFEQLYDQDNKVTVGERIVTSNISEKYVEGLFIGYVSEIQQDPNNLTKTGTIVTPVDFGHLKDVFVITTNKQDAIDKSEDASNEK